MYLSLNSLNYSTVTSSFFFENRQIWPPAKANRCKERFLTGKEEGHETQTENQRFKKTEIRWSGDLPECIDTGETAQAAFWKETQSHGSDTR